jgi:hypothetical protein
MHHPFTEKVARRRLRIEPKSCWRHMESVLPNVLPQESNFEETSDVLIPSPKRLHLRSKVFEAPAISR